MEQETSRREFFRTLPRWGATIVAGTTAVADGALIARGRKGIITPLIDGEVSDPREFLHTIVEESEEDRLLHRIFGYVQIGVVGLYALLSIRDRLNNTESSDE